MNSLTTRSIALCFVAMTVLISSCATVIHGTRQEVGITSQPSGAKVSIDNVTYGITPMFARLSRSKTHIIKIELEGYQEMDLTINRKVSGWVWGNIVIGGLIGLVIDSVSGGLYALTPEQINAVLNKDVVNATEKDGRIFIAMALKSDPAWRKIGKLEKM